MVQYKDNPYMPKAVPDFNFLKKHMKSFINIMKKSQVRRFQILIWD
jgi:hypothetical protein